MTKGRWFTFGTVLLLLHVGAEVKAASLDGVSVTIDWWLIDASIGQQVVTVGPDIEVSCPDASSGVNGSLCNPFVNDTVTFDLGSDSIAFQVLDTTCPSCVYAMQDFNGYRFSGLGVGGYWDHFFLETNILGLSESRGTFDGSTLSINLAGLNFSPNQWFAVTLLAAPVPVPPALWLFVFAICGTCSLLATRHGV